MLSKPIFKIIYSKCHLYEFFKILVHAHMHTRMHARTGVRGRGRESQANSELNVEPNVGLNATTLRL